MSDITELINLNDAEGTAERLAEHGVTHEDAIKVNDFVVHAGNIAGTEKASLFMFELVSNACNYPTDALKEIALLSLPTSCFPELEETTDAGITTHSRSAFHMMKTGAPQGYDFKDWISSINHLLIAAHQRFNR